MTKEVMKQALNVLLLVEAEMNCEYGVTESLRQAIAEAEKQGQGEQLARLGWQEIDCPICGGGARAFPKQEQGEPVAWMSEDEHTVYTSKQVDGCFQHDHIPLYTTPQTKEWVGLSGKEVNAIYSKIAEKVGKHWDEGGTTMMFPETLYDAIEAKLKDKNT